MMPRAFRFAVPVVVLAVAWTFPRSAADPIGGSDFPVGSIAIWSGALEEIPEGWVLCDGNDGTPDLRDRFIRGAADGEEPGTAGGSPAHGHPSLPHSHTIPPQTHSHAISGNLQVSSSGHTHVLFGSVGGSLPGNNPFSSALFADDGHTHFSVSQDGQHAHTMSVTATSSSFTSPVSTTDARSVVLSTPSHVPPFYALAFIMKVADSDPA